MLDAMHTKSFIKNIHQDTDETIRVAAVLSRHKEAPGEYDWLRNGPNNETTSSPTNNNTLEPTALERLKKLADHAIEETEKRHRQENLTMAILESLATPNPQTDAMPIPPIETKIETQETRLEMPAISKSDSGSNRAPTKYQNCTLSPYVLLISAIIENRRYIGDEALPSNLYVSDALISQLHKDMKHCINQEFNGKSIPFFLLDGRRIDIPVLSAKMALGVDLPWDMVWCSNGIAS